MLRESGSILGVQSATVFYFGLDLKGKGLQIGELSGGSCSNISNCYFTSFTNWKKQGVFVSGTKLFCQSVTLLKVVSKQCKGESAEGTN